MKKLVTVEIGIEVSIPDEKIDEILDGYNKTIGSGNEGDLFEHIGWTIARERFSGKDFVEGIGSLSDYGIVAEEVHDDVEHFDDEQ